MAQDNLSSSSVAQRCQKVGHPCWNSANVIEHPLYDEHSLDSRNKAVNKTKSLPFMYLPFLSEEINMDKEVGKTYHVFIRGECYLEKLISAK